MKKDISNKLKSIQPSVTLAITAKAKSLKAQGVDIIGFGAGEPDFRTPKHIRDAAINAIENESEITEISENISLLAYKKVLESYTYKNEKKYRAMLLSGVKNQN
ncbi:MAG: hypothetical protein RSC84_05885, partial [Peptostreptococcaceae bacterium]